MSSKEVRELEKWTDEYIRLQSDILTGRTAILVEAIKKGPESEKFFQKRLFSFLKQWPALVVTLGLANHLLNSQEGGSYLGKDFGDELLVDPNPL